MQQSIKASVIAALVVWLMPTAAAAKKENVFIEQVAVMAAHQGVCGEQIPDDAMQTAIGSAMIQLAINKDSVIKRAKKRAYAIVNDIKKNGTRNGFCSAFMYYLKNGYPR